MEPLLNKDVITSNRRHVTSSCTCCCQQSRERKSRKGWFRL